MRSVKTDFVSCPSCGRTLFDLQEVTEQIKQKTGHLPGVAIAIMVRRTVSRNVAEFIFFVPVSSASHLLLKIESNRTACDLSSSNS
jgi:GcpE protein